MKGLQSSKTDGHKGFKFMRFVIALLLLLTVSSGCRKAQNYAVPMPDDTYKATQDISRIIINYVDEWKTKRVILRHSYAFKCPATGRFLVWMDFHSMLLLDVAESRRVLVNLSEGLLEMLNTFPFFYPPNDGDTFTHFDLYISIEFESFHGQYVDPLLVGRVELKEGYFNAFYAHTALDPRSCVFHQHFEPYESSVHFVKIEQEIERQKALEAPPDGKKRSHFFDVETNRKESPYKGLGAWVE